MGVRLLWTGRPTPAVPKPCDYVFDRQPGLVPWVGSGGDWHTVSTPDELKKLSINCTGNKADCASSGAPAQPIGMTYTYAVAELFAFSLSNHGSCTNRRMGGLNYPGIGEVELGHVQKDFGGAQPSMLWACAIFIDPAKHSCEIIWTTNTCGGWSDKKCNTVTNFPFDQIAQETVENKLLDAVPQAASEAPLEQMFKDFEASEVTDKAAQAYYNIFIKDLYPSWATTAQKKWRSWFKFKTEQYSVDYPVFTADMLRKTCSKSLAMLVLASDALQYLHFLGNLVGEHALHERMLKFKHPFYCGDRVRQCIDEVNKLFPELKVLSAGPLEYFEDQNKLRAKTVGSCDHGVYLETCDEDKGVYTIWTWGSTVQVPASWMLGDFVYYPGSGRDFNKTWTSGLVCTAIVADEMSFAPTTK